MAPVDWLMMTAGVVDEKDEVVVVVVVVLEDLVVAVLEARLGRGRWNVIF